ncbi:hypothetical protein BCR35DRAFT_333449 [Leucosporidium creatinivorum]|uniref:Uncharacterized protein n=1 Tax=Leucosporidium creatinivorum TaxID=106004 RepID=A0A1Y2ETZ6_9BASI|nr:hypothetical protein BCR35DRAFT_333449 [Leucosporidium creatinivorum]
MSDSSEQLLDSLSKVHLNSEPVASTSYIVSRDGDRIPVEPHLLAAHTKLWPLDDGLYEDEDEYRRDEGASSLRLLWELGEKYRARKVVKIAERGMHELVKTDPLLAFTIAAHLQNEPLMTEAAHGTLKERLLSQMDRCVDYRGAPAPAKRRLEQYHYLHLHAIRSSLGSAPRQKPCLCYRSYQNPRAHQDSYEHVRNESFDACFQKLVPATIPYKLLRAEVEERKPRVRGCKGCEKRLDKDVAAVKEDWEARGEIVVLVVSDSRTKMRRRA